MEKINFGGWNTCYRLSNGVVEVVITGEVGPRIIHFGLTNGENVFKEFSQMMGRTGGDEWRVYGGHQLWHAPEQHPHTYFPDNSPVRAEAIPRGARIIQPIEPTTGIEKTMDITLAGGAATAFRRYAAMGRSARRNARTLFSTQSGFRFYGNGSDGVEFSGNLNSRAQSVQRRNNHGGVFDCGKGNGTWMTQILQIFADKI